jgi:hypothetical protein
MFVFPPSPSVLILSLPFRHEAHMLSQLQSAPRKILVNPPTPATHVHRFWSASPLYEWGLAFACDADGIVDTLALSPQTLAAYHACLLGEFNGQPMIDGGIEPMPDITVSVQEDEPIRPGLWPTRAAADAS